ncbi:MAG: DNA polymerase I [Candidatus Gracilibacteria bacterium]
MFDIQIAGFLLDPARREPTLSHLVEKHLDIIIPDDHEEQKVVEAHFMPQLQEILTKKLKEEGLYDVYSTMEVPLSEVLSEIEITGIKIDTAYLKELSVEMTRDMHVLEKEIYKIADEEFNINSPKQLQVILFEKLKLSSFKKTKTGFSTNVQVLTELAEVHPLPAKILEYRQFQKLLSTYVDVLPTLVDSENRLHTTFRQTIAATGRLSSSDPNLQNIPIRTDLGRKIRKAFIAKEGYKLLSADYSQIELRMLAHFSGDPTLIEAFTESDTDIHSKTAALIFSKTPEEVTSQERRIAKTVNFGVIYGMGPFKLSQDLKISRKEASGFIERYFETYSKVDSFMKGLEANAKDIGCLQTLSGRKRYFPELKSSNRVLYEAAKREAINFPIQGSAADLIKIAMLNVAAELKKRKLSSRMVLQIHDELLVEVKEEEAKEVTHLLVEEMQNVLKLKVPLKVEAGIGDNWLDAH